MKKLFLKNSGHSITHLFLFSDRKNKKLKMLNGRLRDPVAGRHEDQIIACSSDVDETSVKHVS